jgi:signal transduction histidine kinase
VLALALIGCVAYRLYQIVPENDENRKQLISLKTDYFQITAFVQSNLGELEGIVSNYFQTKDAAQLELFQTRYQEFKQWLQEENVRWKPLGTPIVQSAHSPCVGETNQLTRIQTQMLPLIASIETALRNYRNAASYLMNNAGKPLAKEWSTRELNFHHARSRLLTLSRQARMRGEATDLFLANTLERHGNMKALFENLRFALLLALVGLSFLLMLAIYRRKLSQSDQIISQHNRRHLEQQANLDKLGHFGRLAQELAHEIKQPLTAITARAYTLQKLIPPGADAHKDVAIIRNEIKRLDNIVKDFLEFARPADPRLDPLTAVQALEEIRDLMESQLEQEAITLKFECEEDLQLLGDAEQLKQVLINLVRNAAESIEGSGTITLRSRKATRMLHGENTEAVILEVEDTGPGIPLDIQDKIFDPFFSTKKHGTGLGLAIAAGIVDKQGGNLEFDSQPGNGTVFRIIMPAATQKLMHEQRPAH